VNLQQYAHVARDDANYSWRMSELAVTLSGRFVTLTPLGLDDVAGLVGAASGDRTTFKWSHIPDSIEGMEAVVRTLLADQEARNAVPFVTRSRESGEIIGMTRFLLLRWWRQRPYPDAAEIGGTFLAAPWQRTQCNTEAKLLMMSHAFDVWGVQRLDLKSDARNERSRRAMERLGAHFEGVLRSWQPSQVDGEEGLTRDSSMYSLLPSEWPDVKARLIERLQ
jgi:RimJ/RimL family protein N-acetyltransferase